METAYRKIFWGLIIANVNLTLGVITIFPTFVGWLVVFSGLSELEEKMSDRQFSMAYWSVLALVLLTLAGGVFTFFQGDAWTLALPFVFYPVILLLIELTAFHNILDGAVERLIKNNHEHTGDIFRKKHRNYLVLMGVSIIQLTLATILNQTAMLLLGTLLTLASTVYLLTVFYALKKEDHHLK